MTRMNSLADQIFAILLKRKPFERLLKSHLSTLPPWKDHLSPWYRLLTILIEFVGEPLDFPDD